MRSNIASSVVMTLFVMMVQFAVNQFFLWTSMEPASPLYIVTSSVAIGALLFSLTFASGSEMAKTADEI